MVISAKIDSRKLMDAFNRAPEVAARLLRQNNKTQSDAVVRHARKKHRFKTKSGTIERVIDSRVSESGLIAEVFLNTARKTYPVAVHEGSRPHKIKAKNAGGLFFVKGGIGFLVPKKGKRSHGYPIDDSKNTFVTKKNYVEHPGTKPDPFIYDAARAKEKQFYDSVNKTVDKILVEVGLK